MSDIYTTSSRKFHENYPIFLGGEEDSLQHVKQKYYVISFSIVFVSSLPFNIYTYSVIVYYYVFTFIFYALCIEMFIFSCFNFVAVVYVHWLSRN